MKTRNVHLPLLLFGLLSASPALAVRDPFWPIGYSPASAKVPEPVHVAEPAPEPEPPRENPVSTDDWLKARKALTISGTTIATKPGTHETRTLVMINRQMYAAGDTVSVDFDTGQITNVTRKKTFQAAPFPPFMKELIAQGGLVPYVKTRLAAKK